MSHEQRAQRGQHGELGVEGPLVVMYSGRWSGFSRTVKLTFVGSPYTHTRNFSYNRDFPGICIISRAGPLK